MKISLIIAVLITLLNLTGRAQDTGFNNFIKREGYVKFTDTAHLPLPVKRNYHKIEKFFTKNHLNKNNYYIKSNSFKSDNNCLYIFIRGFDGLIKLKKQKEQNLLPPPGGLGEHDGTLIVDLKSGLVQFKGEE
jgi:hypothetical protein